MSSRNHNTLDLAQIEQMTQDALKERKSGDIDGLSIEYPQKQEDFFGKIKTVMIVLGLPSKFSSDLDFALAVKNKIAERIGKPVNDIDFRIHSYTSLDNIELTVFMRHRNYTSNFLLDHFLKSFLKWHKQEKIEHEYLLQDITSDGENEFLEDVRRSLAEELGGDLEKMLQKNFDYPIIVPN